ncbi:hypothetical protein Val02_07030 [Virgisporangium aliadipatigenens]|uniref:Uncharacterized protein n=1 Tax=Virgisporangium aliadipatigenens TaxID=741659 RepID=A0A8J3YG70_9ACTN|nr:hypothetical protein [Virgisporangium aliadipatigenens]GIJ43817.1 hypothetical protein Val02_07030 [Virgisporangium aliadipatigenens]
MSLAWIATALRVFIDDETLRVRQSILTITPLHEEYYPAELLPLRAEVIAVARAHPNEGIRRRVEEQVR